MTAGGIFDSKSAVLQAGHIGQGNFNKFFLHTGQLTGDNKSIQALISAKNSFVVLILFIII